MKYVVIGGVAGGASFACRLRRLDEFCSITIYEKTNFVSYANCGLPYYISSVIDNKQNLVLQTKESLKKRFNIDVYTNCEVVEILKDEHKIKIKNLNTKEEFFDTYDKLIISTGAEAIKLAPIEDNIFELKTVEDTLKIKHYIDTHQVKNAVVIGGGFIGLEILENLNLLNIQTTLIEGKSHCLNNIDAEMAVLLHDELISHNVNLKLNTIVKNITKKDNKIYVKTDGDIFEVDLLIIAVGVKPASKLAYNKLDLSIKNTIKVDNNFKTSDDDIYAVGDVTAIVSQIDNDITYIPLAGNANKEGRELANHLINQEEINIKAIGTSILKIFDLNIASTGLSEEALQAKHIPYQKIYLTPTNHASYYPNSYPLTMKVMFNNEYEILGAQIIGKEGVDKRIDLLAVAIKFHIKGYNLKQLELAYAPPFSSAKDPINMVGYMIENIKNGLVKQFYAEQIEDIKKDNNNLLVDVRTRYEYDMYHIDGSINIPIDELRENTAKLDSNKQICLICLSAIRSYIGCRILSQKGYNCAHLAGGMRIYSLYERTKAK